MFVSLSGRLCVCVCVCLHVSLCVIIRLFSSARVCLHYEVCVPVCVCVSRLGEAELLMELQCRIV